MGVSYSAKDETIDRLFDTNKKLREEVLFLNKAAKAKDENNLKLAEKVKEQADRIKFLEAELNASIDLHEKDCKLDPRKVSECVDLVSRNIPILCKFHIMLDNGKMYNYAEILGEAAAMLRNLVSEKCS